MALPPNASCEDIDIDPHLPFLNRFVQAALESGSAPYIPGGPPADWKPSNAAVITGQSHVGCLGYINNSMSVSSASCSPDTLAHILVATTNLFSAHNHRLIMSAAEDRRSLGLVRASADDGHAAAAKPIKFQAYERPTLPAARQQPPALATQPTLATGQCLQHAAVCRSSSQVADSSCCACPVHAKLGAPP